MSAYAIQHSFVFRKIEQPSLPVTLTKIVGLDAIEAKGDGDGTEFTAIATLSEPIPELPGTLYLRLPAGRQPIVGFAIPETSGGDPKATVPLYWRSYRDDAILAVDLIGMAAEFVPNG